MRAPKADFLEIGKRLVELRKERHLNQIQAAATLGINNRTYQNYEYGFSKPNTENLKKIIDYYGCSYHWFLTGQGERFSTEGGPSLSDFTIIPPQPDFPVDDFVFIRQVNGKISAGGGMMPDDTADMLCAFRKDWVKRKGGKPDRMSLIKVDGDSMEPTLMAGDLVLVDHSRTVVTPQGGIYALSIDDEIMIKRVQPVYPDKLLVISDNKQYPAQEIATENVRVNGKIIWYGREMEK